MRTAAMPSATSRASPAGTWRAWPNRCCRSWPTTSRPWRWPRVIDAFPARYRRICSAASAPSSACLADDADDDSADSWLADDWLALLQPTGSISRSPGAAWPMPPPATSALARAVRRRARARCVAGALARALRQRERRQRPAGRGKRRDRARRGDAPRQPMVIPRNHRVEEALAAASDDDDLAPFDRLLEASGSPMTRPPARALRRAGAGRSNGVLSHVLRHLITVQAALRRPLWARLSNFRFCTTGHVVRGLNPVGRRNMVGVPLPTR